MKKERRSSAPPVTLEHVRLVLMADFPEPCPARDRALVAMAVCTDLFLEDICVLRSSDFVILDGGRAPFDLAKSGRLFRFEPAARKLLRNVVQELEQRGGPHEGDVPLFQGRPGLALTRDRVRQIVVGAFRRIGFSGRDIPGQLRYLHQRNATTYPIPGGRLAEVFPDREISILKLGLKAVNQ